MWLFRRDPLFLEKASLVLDLYQGRWQGEPLSPHDYVLSANEKSGIQALERRHAPVPPGFGRPHLIEHEYIRHGTAAYLAALGVFQGRIHGRMEQTTGIDPFMRLVHHVMKRRP